MAELLDIDRVIHEEVHSLSAGSSGQLMGEYLHPGRLIDQYAQPQSRTSANPPIERGSAPRTSGVGSNHQLGYQHRMRASEVSSRGLGGENSCLTFEEKESLKLEIRERAHKELEKIKLARSNVSRSSPNQDEIISPTDVKVTKAPRRNSRQNKCSSPPLSKQPSQTVISARNKTGGCHSLAVSISSAGKSTPQKIGPGNLGSQSQLIKSQTIISLEKELELYYRRKLAEAKHTITTTVREELAARFQEETGLLEAERAEVAQFKSDLAAKTLRVQQFKEEVTRDFENKEQQYLEIIQDLQTQVEALTSRLQTTDAAPVGDRKPEDAKLPFDGIDRRHSRSYQEWDSQRDSRKIRYHDFADKESNLQQKVSPPKPVTVADPRDVRTETERSLFAQMEDQRNRQAYQREWHDPFEIQKTDTLQQIGKRIIEERLKQAHDDAMVFDLDREERSSQRDLLVSEANGRVDQHVFGEDILIAEPRGPQGPTDTIHSVLQQSLRTKGQQTLGGLQEDTHVKLSDRTFRDRTYEKSDPGDLRPKTLLELILEPFGWDDAKSQHMKKVRKLQLRSRMCEDVQLPRIEALLLVVQTNFSSLCEGIEDLHSTLSQLLEKLRSLWIYTNWSCDDRMTVLERLELCVDPDEALCILRQEVNNLSSLKQNYATLYDQLAKRVQVRRQLELVAMELNEEVSELLLFNRRTSSLYMLLRKVNTRILGLLHKKGPRGPWISFPVLMEGSPVDELIALDFWEEEYLRRLEGRLKAGAV